MSALQEFPRITPFLWFDSNAEEAVDFYLSVEAVSFVVRCDSQQEVDEYWSKLSAGGSEVQCGWLKDKFGLSWQIVPACLPGLIKNPKAMQAMLQMKKLDIAELERAARS
ncbi:MAG: VOC family protein [Acidobacteria bacterium]|nr:VOC family protein [Acidobacteriota bacterium]